MKHRWSKLLIAVMILVVLSSGLCAYLFIIGYDAFGSDIYGHIFKMELLYERIAEGDFFPKYTERWYNGIQPFRYWAPLPYYFLALLKTIAMGNTMAAYFMFAGVSCFVGGMGFVLIGAHKNRIEIGTVMGAMWFFMPDNMRVFFSEGNFPRMFIAMLLPYFMYFVVLILERDEHTIGTGSLVGMFSLLIVFSLSHLMIAAMIAIGIFVLFAINSVIKKSLYLWFTATVTMLISFVSCAIFIVPALQGGIVGMDSTATREVMHTQSVTAAKSLNMFLRLESTDGRGIFYFGIAMFIISLIGSLFAGKNSRVWFLLSIFIFLATTPVFSLFLEELPMSELFWMSRFTPIATAAVLIGLIEWGSCKSRVMLGFIILLIIDILPSLTFISPNQDKMEAPLINEAKEITQQRMALLDLSLWDSKPSYDICTEPDRTLYSYGWAWQGTNTATNIMLLNSALEHGSYYYIFDRALELGNDTVLVKKDLLSTARNVTPITKCANASGYELVEETKTGMLFHRETPKCFGTKTIYENIAIGHDADVVPVMYPSFLHGDSDRIDDYSFEELSQYKTLYLSGFTYKDKTYAEDLLLRLSKNGTKVVIDTDHVNNMKNSIEFLDFTAYTIKLRDEYPRLFVNTRELSHKTIPEKSWITTYPLENCNYDFEPLITTFYAGKSLDVVAKHGNICMVGFNLFHYAFSQNDTELLDIFDGLFGTSRHTLPQRKLVPIEVIYGDESISISSPESCVNTSIASQDIFTSEDSYTISNNLIVVEDGKTNFRYKSIYSPILWVLSLLGICGMAMFCVLRKKRIRSHKPAGTTF